MSTISFSGLASGIDGDAIIKALLDARRLAAAPLETKVENNKKESDSLEEFNTKLLTLKDKLEDFQTLNGSAITKNAASSNTDAVRATAGASALNSSTTINVLALARTSTLSFSDRFSALDQPIFPGLAGTGTMQITIGSGSAAQTVNVDVDSTTTLGQLVEKINTAGGGKLQALALNTSTAANPQYLLAISSTSAGTEKGALSITVGPEITGQGLLASQTVSQATDALVDVAGVGQFSRPTNQISDLIPGVTLDLKQEGAGPVTISVSSDSEKTANKLGEVVDAFNELVKYSRDNSKIERIEGDDGSVTNKYGSLARTRVDEQAIEAIRNALSGAVSRIENSPVRNSADLGIATQRDGTLKFDTAAFIKAVSADPVSTEDILHQFADKTASTAGVIAAYTKFQGTIEQAQSANDQENETLTERIARLDRTLEQQRANMKEMFARLESTISKMNSSASALTGILAGLGK